MPGVDFVDVPGLGNRSCPAGGPRGSVAVDPPRDIDRIIAAAARRGVRIAYVVEMHLHNDYVTGGPELARLTGAAYLVLAGARVAYERVPVHDGDTVEIDADRTLRAVATPGHTPHHTAYVLEEAGVAVAAATGSPADWLREGERPRSFPRGSFADLAQANEEGGAVILDVRRASERAAASHIAGSVHIPVHRLRDLLTGIPDANGRVHAAPAERTPGRPQVVAALRAR